MLNCIGTNRFDIVYRTLRIRIILDIVLHQKYFPNISILLIVYAVNNSGDQ